jgi:hypothetical protein
LSTAESVGYKVEELEHEADLATPQTRELRLAHAVDPLAIEPDLSRRRSIEAGEQIEQSRLAAAARAHDRDELASLDRQVDAPKGRHLRAAGLVCLRELPRFQYLCHQRSSIDTSRC